MISALAVPHRPRALVARRRRARRGISLVELMIVVAILIGLTLVVVPVGSSLLRLEQRQAAARLGTIYDRLQNEAMLRNMTFRIAFHLEDRYYEVEGSTDPALLFVSPEQRVETEAKLAEALERRPSRFADDADPFAVDEDGLALQQAQFTAVQDKFLKRFDLPGGVRFGGVYTPGYGFVTPSREAPEAMKDEDKQVVFAYILPSGVAEHAVVQMVYESNPERGFTVEIEPMTGRVHVDAVVRDWDDRFSFVPTRGPDLP